MPSGLPTPVPRTEKLTTKVEPALFDAVARYADQHGLSTSTAVRDLLAASLDMDVFQLETVVMPYIGTCRACGWLLDPGFPCDLCSDNAADAA